jgi:hypothetical protein
MVEAIKKKIQEMFLEDQVLRNRIFSPDYSPTDTDWDELQKLDDQHKEELKRIIDKIGFPTISRVGKDSSYQAWLLVQHATNDLPFMKSYLDEMQKYKDDVDPKNIAYLFDRVAIMGGEKQRFGTQLLLNKKNNKYEVRPLEDPDNVDSLRNEFGLETLSKYLSKANENRR